MEKILPTLSTSGFINDKSILMNKLMLYYKTTVKNQSTIYDGNIISFLKTLEVGKDMADLRSRITDDLINLYNRYFKTTEAIVSIKENENDTYDIEMDVTSKDEEGNTYSILENTIVDKLGIEKVSETLNKYNKDI